MKRALLVSALVAAVSACGSGAAEGDARTAADTLTRAQKDTLISEMPIPGAGAVGRALDAAGRANARAEAHDTIR